MLIGVISDTHGTLTQGALNALRGVDHILHAGDVGSSEVLKMLEAIAPLSAVRGNMDGARWSKTLPPSDMIELAGTVFYLIHDLHGLDIDPAAAGVQVVISGHTHKASIEHDRGVLFFNPGSASYGRYGRPASIGRIELTNGAILPRIIPTEGE